MCHGHRQTAVAKIFSIHVHDCSRFSRKEYEVLNVTHLKRVKWLYSENYILSKPPLAVKALIMESRCLFKVGVVQMASFTRVRSSKRGFRN
jgi:hypothetical protein